MPAQELAATSKTARKLNLHAALGNTEARGDLPLGDELEFSEYHYFATSGREGIDCLDQQTDSLSTADSFRDRDLAIIYDVQGRQYPHSLKR